MTAMRTLSKNIISRYYYNIFCDYSKSPGWESVSTHSKNKIGENGADINLEKKLKIHCQVLSSST